MIDHIPSELSHALQLPGATTISFRADSTFWYKIGTFGPCLAGGKHIPLTSATSSLSSHFSLPLQAKLIAAKRKSLWQVRLIATLRLQEGAQQCKLHQAGGSLYLHPHANSMASNPASYSSPDSSASCFLCRQRKTKCDRLLPRCGFCVKAKVECQYVPRPKKRGLRAGYVSELESRIGMLV
jgi:hypothetical protein